MDITVTKYVVEFYDNGKDPELNTVSENDFGHWIEFNDTYDNYDDAMYSMQVSVSHSYGVPHRIRTRTTHITTTESTIYSYTPVEVNEYDDDED